MLARRVDDAVEHADAGSCTRETRKMAG